MNLNIIEREKISEGFLKVERLKIQLPSGEKFQREVLLKKDVVAIVAVTPEGEIYLTKQPRAGIGKLDSIEIPAGLLENGENPEEAAKRELLEETGTVSDKWTYLGFFVGDPACVTSVTHLYLAENVKVVAELDLDEDEYLVSYKEKIDTVKKLLEDYVIVDANSVIALTRTLKKLSK